MKRVLIFFCFIILILTSKAYTSQNESPASGSDKFKIIFVADSWGLRSEWLKEIKTNWKATGVALYVSWKQNQPFADDSYSFDSLDAHLKMIKDAGLDIYLKVMMGREYPARVNEINFDTTDFQIDQDGKIFSLYDVPKVLNFASDNSKKCMLTYLDALLNHLDYLTQQGYEFKEIIPSTNPDTEFEYTYAVMLGYSGYEKQMFVKSLESKYDGDIRKLNSVWETSFSYFTEIDPQKYNWYEFAPFSYTVPNGRVDWINFRTMVLKNFIDDCALVIHKHNYKMGLQLGSLSDWGIERRGWYDPTSLIENVDAVRVADVIEYKPDFNFEADYLRSVCNYWGKMKGKTITFSTESDWQGYNDHKPSTLSADWSTQLTSYYNKGSDVHFIMGWYLGFHGLTLSQISAYGGGEYSVWKKTLAAYSNKKLQHVEYSRAVHLSCEQGFQIGNVSTLAKVVDDVRYLSFGFLNSITQADKNIKNTNSYNDSCDIVTNYILKFSPDYVFNKYTSLSLTKSSYYMPDEVYTNLLKGENRINLINSTSTDNSNGNGENMLTPGMKDEYNNTRTQHRLPLKQK